MQDRFSDAEKLLTSISVITTGDRVGRKQHCPLGTFPSSIFAQHFLKILTALFVILLAPLSAQTPKIISLDQAIDIAMTHNHSLKATRTLILQNQAQEITANLRPNPS